MRALYGYMWAHPGKKLLFMGDEIAQWREWNHDSSLDWHLMNWGDHQGVFKLVCDLNDIYRKEPALHQVDFEWQGFEWLELHDWENSVLSFLRRGRDSAEAVVVICNFTPVPRYDYRVGVPVGGYYREILNSDAGHYGGSNLGNEGGVWAHPEHYAGRSHHICVKVPPLGVVYLKVPKVS